MISNVAVDKHLLFGCFLMLTSKISPKMLVKKGLVSNPENAEADCRSLGWYPEGFQTQVPKMEMAWMVASAAESPHGWHKLVWAHDGLLMIGDMWDYQLGSMR